VFYGINFERWVLEESIFSLIEKIFSKKKYSMMPQPGGDYGCGIIE
jgi:hypothetical protein